MVFLEKLKSRKFIAAVAGIIAGLAVIFGVDEGTVATISGAIVSAASLVSYIVVEGKLDAEALQKPAKNGDDIL